MSKSVGIALLAVGVGVAYVWAPGEDRMSNLADQVAQVTQIFANGVNSPAPAKGPTAYQVPAPATAEAVGPRVFSSSRPLMTPGGGAIAVEPGPTKAGVPPAVASFVAPSTSPAVIDVPQRRLLSSRPADDDARKELTRDLQRELKRVGCYDGEVNGAWGAATKRSMAAFIDRVNATLPLEEPDYILLTLVQGHAAQACGKSCPAGQGLNADGKCLPRAILAQKTKRSTDDAVIAKRDQPIGALASQGPALLAPPAVAKRPNGWSTVGAAPTAPPVAEAKPVLNQTARPIAPLPGRMAMGAATNVPLNVEAERPKNDLARRKAELAAAAETQRLAELDALSERRAKVLARQQGDGRLAKAEAISPPPANEAGVTSQRGLDTRAREQAQIDKERPRLAAIDQQPGPQFVGPVVAPSGVVVLRAPAPRLAPPPYAVVGRVTAPPPRPAYIPQPNRWTRNIFSDLNSKR